jgi:hypothetical protein
MLHLRPRFTRLLIASMMMLGMVGSLVLPTASASAQAPPSSLNLNAYQCPSGYDQISDCTKLADVVVNVKQDGQPLGQLVSRADEGATLDLMWGAFVELEIAGGVPEGTVLEDTGLSFDAVEGVNAVTLTFVSQDAPPPPSSSHVSVVAWFCPAGYAGQVDACTRLADVFVDVTQDGQPLGQLRTSSTDAATLEVLPGAFIDLTIAGGVPERSDLESDLDLSFTAVEGDNPVMLVFVAQDDVPPPHSDTNALVAQALVCPVEYAGDNYARDCVGDDGITVTVTRDADGFSVSDVTGIDGIVGFQGLGEGTYTVELGVPGDFASFLTFCGVPGEVEPRQVTNPDTNRIGVYLGPTEELTCTFFIVPVDAGAEPTPPDTGAEPTPAPAAKPTPSVPVTALPSTGSGSTVSDGGGIAALSLLLGVSILLGLAGIRLMGQRFRI